MLEIVSHLQKKLRVYPVLGVELEFYVIGMQEDNLDALVIDLSECALALSCELAKESCKNQYELRIGPCNDVTKLLSTMYQAQELLCNTAAKYDCSLNFAAKPFQERAGSAFHVNINLASAESRNLFAKNKNGLFSDVLMHSLGGLCACLKEHMIFFAPNDASYMRFVHPDIHTPTTVSWGVNNRSTALRLTNTRSAACRIEHRVPCADCLYEKTIYAILFGIAMGLENTYLPPERIYGIAADSIYNLEKLPLSLEEARSLYEQRKHRDFV